MYLSIRDDKAFETVRAYVIEGRLRIDRGIPPSVACPHHFGATVTSISPTVVNVVKDFIDQYGLWDGDLGRMRWSEIPPVRCRDHCHPNRHDPDCGDMGHM